MTTETVITSPYRKTGTANGPRTGGTSTYSALLQRVKDDGLLRRRRGFYWSVFAALVVATAAC
jgi:hypothetical protein